MENLSILTAGATAVILFIFGLDHFSAEIERISGERFRRALSKATSVPIIGVAIGAVVTAVIQSSSATSVIAISLVNAGVLSFKNSVGIIIGSNIGTTVTAQLVAFKLTAFAPVLIILGFILSLVRSRMSIFGKSIFYFGFVFFALNLISSSLSPLQNNPALIAYLMEPQNPLVALLIGCLFTALIQSSSVTTALAIIFTQQGLIGLENAIPIIIGANIGTTATALIAVFSMDRAARKTALAHLLFNVGGVVIFAPLFIAFSSSIASLEISPEFALANVHLAFNLATSILFVIFINPFTRLIDRLVGEGQMDFQRITLPSSNTDIEFDELRRHLEGNLQELLDFLQENYNLVTLSIETNYRGVYDAAERRIDYVEFLEKETMAYFAGIVGGIRDEEKIKVLLSLITRFDYLFQIHDSIIDLFNTKKVINTGYIDLNGDILLIVREVASQTLMLFDAIRNLQTDGTDTTVSENSHNLYQLLGRANHKLLELLANPERRDAGSLTNFITYSRRLRDKLINYSSLA
ncbi:MAG: Na/Pi symporter [Proteobacteria bacterium]|nr:Na/Pi symporter [Pseudomonadota bacterium]